MNARQSLFVFLLAPGVLTVLWRLLASEVLRLPSSSFTDFVVPAFIAALLAPAMEFVFFLPVVAVVLLAIYLLERQKQRACPDAVVITDLLLLLSALEWRSSRDLTSLKTKRALLQKVEAAAKSVQKCLPASLRTGDPNTDDWLRSRMAQIAGYIRGLKIWILTPKGDTESQLRATVANLCTLTIMGRWDSMPTESVAKAFSPGRWRHRIVRYGLPALAFAVAVLSADYAGARWGHIGYAVVGYTAYVLTVALATADPVSATAIKEALSNIRIGPRS